MPMGRTNTENCGDNEGGSIGKGYDFAVVLLNPGGLDFEMFVEYTTPSVMDAIGSSQLEPGKTLQWQDRGWNFKSE